MSDGGRFTPQTADSPVQKLEGTNGSPWSNGKRPYARIHRAQTTLRDCFGKRKTASVSSPITARETLIKLSLSTARMG